VLLNINSFTHQHCQVVMFLPVFLNLAWASVCGAEEKGNPATADQALAGGSATVRLSVLSAALPSRSDFFQLIL